MFEIEFANIPCGDYLVSGYFRRIKKVMLDVDFLSIKTMKDDGSLVECELSSSEISELEYEFSKMVYDGSVDAHKFGPCSVEDF